MVITSNRRNPFPGLRPFELDEEHLFFGREGQSDDLISRLHRTHFLGVVGTSGSGKSSLVRAGLLPSLYSGFLPGASSSWRIAILRPGSSPMRNLAEELNTSDVFGEASVSEDEAIIQIALTESILRRGSLGLIEVTQQAQMTSDESLLVVVDQFEELFRFKAQAKAAGKQLEAEDEAAAFVKLLLAAVAQREVPIFVVLTMRSDFLGDCAQFRDLPETLNDSQYLIPRLTREQLRRAIEGPVAVGGATMTPRLVNRLLNDTGDNPDQLPILQHALMRTWDYWEDQATPQAPLDLEHYDEIGGMARALSRHADQVYEGFSDSQCEGLKTDRSREIAEVLFKRLTDRGADNREIRRPTRLGEICAVASADLDEVIEVIEAFRGPRRSFLMPPPAVPLHENTMIDISHESLMRNWQRLKAWVDAEAQSATIYRRLAETTAMHEQSKAGFLRDPELTIGLTWRKEQKPNAVWAQRYAPNFEAAIAFLEASNEAARVEAAEKERARKREVNRLRGFLALLGGLSLLTGGAAVYAFNQQQEAQAQTQVAQQQEAAAEEQQQIAEEQRQIAEQEKTNAEEQEKLAITQRETAERAQQDAETQREQAEAASSAEAKQRQQAQVARQRAEEGEAEANRQATIAQEQTAIAEKQTRLAEDNEAAAVAATRTAEIQALNADIQAESFRVENLMASGLNLNALLAAIELGNRIRVEDVGGESVISAVQAKEFDYKSTQEVFNANNSVRSSVSLQAISVLREAYFFEGYREQNTFEGHSDTVEGISFSPDGQMIASGSWDGTAKLWNRQGEALQTLEGHTGGVWDVSFSPDGQTIASASRDGTVKLWNRQGEAQQTLKGQTNAEIARKY